VVHGFQDSSQQLLPFDLYCHPFERIGGSTLPDEVIDGVQAQKYCDVFPCLLYSTDEETAVLAGQVEVKTFTQRQRIWKIGDPGGRAYVLVYRRGAGHDCG